MAFAYLDCPSGISGDMMLGALIDLGVPIEFLNEHIQSVVKNVKITITSSHVSRKEIQAVQVSVQAPREHTHRTLGDILALVNDSKIADKNKKHINSIFRILAQAEGKVHGVAPEAVHFHEVGAADSIADIVGVVVGLDHLNLTDIVASPIPTGSGTVQIAHGTCPVPAPATAELLRGIPLAASDVPFELTTPTGAAILKYYVKRYGMRPAMTILQTGIGAGSRDLPQQANILRILIGEMSTGSGVYRQAKPHVDHQYDHLADPEPIQYPLTHDTVWVIETNVDNMTGELTGHCIDRLWSLAPLDVWVTPIQMKKMRPGITISVLCKQEQIAAVEMMLLSETTTIGVRRYPVERSLLHREQDRIKTIWGGDVDVKRAFLPDGTEKVTPEFESVKRLAAAKGISVTKIMEHLR